MQLMLQTIDAVVQRLVDAYDPERVILFGSRARGVERVDSDVDLLIVKNTTSTPAERRRDVERVLADRAMALDLVVYTPAELLALFRHGSPFVEGIVRDGKVVYMRKATAAWMREVEDELATATLLAANGLLRGGCLHAQQAVEKAMKALLIERAAAVPHTHDLIDLRRRVMDAGWQMPLETEAAVWLNSVCRGRYPTEDGLLPHGEPSADDARQAIETATRAVAFARGALGNAGPGG